MESFDPHHDRRIDEHEPGDDYQRTDPILRIRKPESVVKQEGNDYQQDGHQVIFEPPVLSADASLRRQVELAEIHGAFPLNAVFLMYSRA